MRGRPAPVESRLWEHIAEEDNGCWRWTALCTGGTPIIRHLNRNRSARRFLWPQVRSEPLPRRIEVVCQNPRCVSPAHMHAAGDKGLDWLRHRVRVNGECWVWTGAVRPGGVRGAPRPSMSGEERYVHRWVAREINGECIDDRVVRHTCDNPMCVNPAHLLVGTQAENVQDMLDRKRHMHGVRHFAAKLDPEKIGLAIRLRKSGFTYAEIGDEFGVSAPTIWTALNGRTWKEIRA